MRPKITVIDSLKGTLKNKAHYSKPKWWQFWRERYIIGYSFEFELKVEDKLGFLRAGDVITTNRTNEEFYIMDIVASMETYKIYKVSTTDITMLGVKLPQSNELILKLYSCFKEE